MSFSGLTASSYYISSAYFTKAVPIEAGNALIDTQNYISGTKEELFVLIGLSVYKEDCEWCNKESIIVYKKLDPQLVSLSRIKCDNCQ